MNDLDYLNDNLGPDTMSAAAQRDMSHSKWSTSNVLKEDIAHCRRDLAKGPGIDPYFSLGPPFVRVSSKYFMF